VRLAARPFFFDFSGRPPFEVPVMKLAGLFLALPLLAACERNPDTPTAEESRQLDDAANLLNQAPENLDAVDDGALNPAEPDNRA
jgi:hypothetical protein